MMQILNVIIINISKHLINKLANKPGNWKPLIYCWRGGQRSKSLATILAIVVFPDKGIPNKITFILNTHQSV